MHNRIIRFITILAAAFSLPARAQVFPNLGGQRAGISALTFLKNDLSARSSAMGGASVALPGDAFSMAVNPAGNASLRFPVLAVSSTTNATGIVQSFLGFSLPAKGSGTWMGSLNYLSSGQLKRRTEFQPMGDGTLYSSDAFKAGIGYSRALSKMFSCGMNLNFVREQLGQYSANAITADLGFLYRTDWKDLSFAVGFQHFGGTSTLNGNALAVDFNRTGTSTEGYGAPTMFSMGVSMTAYRSERHKVLASAQLNHPNDNAENIRLGVQYTFDSLFHLRLGYKGNVFGEGITAGAGMQTRLGAFPLSIEYSIVPNDYLGMIHSLGLTLGFIRTGNFEEPGKPAENVPLLGFRRKSRKREIREKVQVDSIPYRIIDQPDFRVSVPTARQPLQIPQDLKPYVAEQMSPKINRIPSTKLPVKKDRIAPAAAGTYKRPKQSKPKVLRMIPSDPKSIWQKPYLRFWTEKQWQVFMNQRFEKETGK